MACPASASRTPASCGPWPMAPRSSRTGSRRGDVNGDGRGTAADARALRDCLQNAGPCPEGCWDAADADDDGQVTPLDVNEIVMATFHEADLPSPGPTYCGPDPTPDGLPSCS